MDDFFRDVISDRLQAIEDAFESVRRGGADTDLRGLAQSLKGAGTSFGLPEISQLAGVVVVAVGQELDDAVAELCAVLTRISTAEHRKTVLIVDDDPLISSLLQLRLAGLDRRVVIVDSLEAARVSITRANPTVIVLDLVLRDGDGRTLLAELKSHPMTATIPVVMMSGSGDVGLRDHCTTLGADAFMVKPFDADSAVHRITAFLDRGVSSGVGELVDLYDRALDAVGSEVTIASVIPETHGVIVSTSPAITDGIITNVESILDLFILPPGRWVRSAPFEFTVITPRPVEEIAAVLDRARFRLRTRRHPSQPEALMSMSVGIARNEPGADIANTLSQARSLAKTAHNEGGDRVTTEARGGGRRVLLAEDDALTAALVIKRLEREGYVVEHHSNGSDALEAFEQSTYALVVLDVNMPKVSGFEVLQSIRSSAYPSTPVVMLTAAGSERDVVRGFELGADDYILKPFSPAELGARLRRFTRRV